jgi:multidrug efflux pump subunit AcrA (membrane-fusion protein)
MIRILQLVSFLGLVSFLAACSGVTPPGGAQQQAAPTSTPIPTAPAVARPTYLVQRGDVQEILEFNGRWQPRDQTALSFPIAGTVRRVNVRRGDAVSAGQLLADYQIGSLEDQLASAKLDLETALANLETGDSSSVGTVADAEVALANAQLNLQKTKEGSPWPQLESARIALDNARQNLINAQRAFDDAISRPQQPASTTDQAYNALLNAQNQLRSAQASYDSAAQSFNNYKFNIASAENQVIQAQLNLEKARRGGADPQKQQAVRAAQLRVDQIQGNIDQSSLYAPSAGEVLEVTIKPGDQVQAFATVITIGRPEPKEAVASIAIGDAQKLSIGLVGICQVLNRPETAVQCVVRRIPTSARDADQTTRVAASLEDLKLPTGQLIDIQMPLNVRRSVLWLPPAAVRTFQNRTFVVLQTPDGPRSADVTVGLRTTDRVEITAGVKEGDVVIGP